MATRFFKQKEIRRKNEKARSGNFYHVLGYTLGNDVSERAWQRSDRTLWRAKNSDTFKPMGPKIVSGIDPMNQTIAGFAAAQ